MSQPHPSPHRPRGQRPTGSDSQRECLTALGLVLVVALAGAVGAGADVVEKFFTIGNMDLDPTCTGTPRRSVVVNQQWPGPAIYAEDGDILKIHVFNNQSLPVTLHWHGLANEDAQWYDGVPGITQCPILAGKSFTIILPIRGQWGTFWYHAHTNEMRNTAHGAVIVSPSRNSMIEPLQTPIEDEFLLMGGDWYTQTAEELDASILSPPYTGYPTPTALHINGLTLCAGPKFYSVRMIKWYRIRVINTALWGSWNLRIENHTMVLHEVEGGYLQHKRVSMLDVYPGQSYSVLVYTNQPPGNYWIVINSRYDIEKSVKLPGAAVLSYESAGEGTGPAQPTTPFPKGPQGPKRNLFGVYQQGTILQAPYVNQELPKAEITKLLVLELNQNNLANKQQLFSFNNVSFAARSRIPFLLADYRGIGDLVYSSSDMPEVPPPGLKDTKDGPVVTAPTVLEVPYGSWVQIVFQNHVPPGGLHPFHLHGQNFFVVAQGSGYFDASKWESYKYNLKNPVLRNTVAMFESMWVAIRFKATNPGQWILHCHLEQHADQGLIAIIKVPWPESEGGSGPKPLPRPPVDYPRCPKPAKAK